MESPLTQERIEELNRISQLPLEEQKKVLPEFLKKLSPEQIEFLKRQQGTSCVFCSIAEGKIKARKVYEDEYLIGALDVKPGNKGHVILFPKAHYEILNQMEEVGHLFNVAKKISSIIFDAVKAEGTDIFVANGAVAGQIVPHVSVHIIPRFKDDKVNFSWDFIKVNDNELDELQREIGMKLYEFNKEKPINEKKELVYVKRHRIP